MATEKSKPWLDGIIDTLVASRLLRESGIPHRNRLAVILLDSAFETMCRAYLRHEAGIPLDDAHRHRPNLMKMIKSKVPNIDPDVWKSIDYFYTEIRNDFYHESASKTLTDAALLDYEETVYFVIDRAFSLKTADLVQAALGKAMLVGAPERPEEVPISLAGIATKVDRVLAGVATIKPRNVEELNTFFKKEGVSLRLSRDEFTSIVARNRGSKNFFYFNKDLKRWELSALGRFRLPNVAGANAR